MTLHADSVVFIIILVVVVSHRGKHSDGGGRGIRLLELRGKAALGLVAGSPGLPVDVFAVGQFLLGDRAEGDTNDKCTFSRRTLSRGWHII
jgi:hypothetical protein